MKKSVPILLTIIVLFGLLSIQATAASFDCKKAASWVEKTVCSNPELSKLDEQMAKAYQDTLASLSPEGQKETKQYQKQWLKEIAPYCKARLKLKFVDDTDECLKDVYKERTTQLQQSLIKFHGRIFRNVHVSHSETKETCPYAFIKQELTYPQIETPRDKNEKSWNTFIIQKVSDDLKLDTDNDCTNIDVKYAVIFTNKHLISLQREEFSYNHGAPHGYTYRASFSRLLDGNKKLQAADLFDEKTRWRTKLAALVSLQMKKDEEEACDVNQSALMEIVTLPSNWVILKDGFDIQLNEYACGDRTAPLITIDWKTLNPYLSKKGHSLIYE